MEKIVLTAQGLLEDSFRLAAKVLNDGFEPTMIIAIWRGGAPVGMAVQELIRYAGVDTDHIAIRTSSYHAGVDQRKTHVAVFGLNYVVNKVVPEDRVLIVDDVFDTGGSIDAVLRELAERTRGNMPKDIRIAVPWYKPSKSKVAIKPDYWLHETDAWIVFPHELDLTPEEMKASRPELAALFGKYLEKTAGG